MLIHPFCSRQFTPSGSEVITYASVDARLPRIVDRLVSLAVRMSVSQNLEVNLHTHKSKGVGKVRQTINHEESMNLNGLSWTNFQAGASYRKQGHFPTCLSVKQCSENSLTLAELLLCCIILVFLFHKCFRCTHIRTRICAYFQLCDCRAAPIYFPHFSPDQHGRKCSKDPNILQLVHLYKYLLSCTEEVEKLFIVGHLLLSMSLLVLWGVLEKL